VNLERNQSALWAALRDLRTQSGIVSSDRPLPSPPEQSRGPSVASHSNDIDDIDDDTDESEDLLPPNAPTHLLQLFHNVLLNSDGHDLGHSTCAASNHSTGSQRTQACIALRALAPSDADMEAIAAYSSSWLPLYASLFPIANIETTPEGILALHNKSKRHDDPVALATLLLFVAMTVQHAPTSATFPTSECMQNLPKFVKNVADTVEHYVILDDALAGTIEGIEASLVFLRLYVSMQRSPLRRVLKLICSS
jgi:hypothetical protein